MKFKTLFCFACLLALLALIAQPLRAEESKLRPDSTASPEARTLEEARTRIAELEAHNAELEARNAELEARKESLKSEAVLPAPAKTEVNYKINPNADEVRFLNLGVRKNYIGVERNRLIDQIHTMIPPLYEPAFSPFHGYTLPPHAFRVAFNNDRFINHHDFGRDQVYARFFDNVKVENQFVNVDFLYGLTANDTLRVVVPFNSTDISGTGKAFRIIPMVMSMNGRGFGIGDVQLMAKHKWFDQGYKRFDFATVLGVQFPTGRHDNRFDDAQTIIMNGMAMPVSASSGGPKVDLFSDDLRIPNSAQPGTGSWGVLAGVMATRQLTGRFRAALHGGALYKAMKNNAQDVRPGNELTLAVSFVRPPTRSEHFTFDLTFLGRNKQSERYPGMIMHPEADENGMPIMMPNGMLKMFVTPRPPFEHGTVMFLSPSLVVIPKPSIRLTVSPMIRIHEPLQGPSPAVRLVFGATTTF